MVSKCNRRRGLCAHLPSINVGGAGAEGDDARAVGEAVVDESVGGSAKRGAAGDAMDATSATVDDLDDGSRRRGSSSHICQLREFRAPLEKQAMLLVFEVCVLLVVAPDDDVACGG